MDSVSLRLMLDLVLVFFLNGEKRTSNSMLSMRLEMVVMENELEGWETSGGD